MERLFAALEGRYRIERELGEGGMATVYPVEDLRHKRNVALKVLKPELAAVVGAERFLAEIETTAGLQHPHILPLHDSGVADGLLFYVMPFIEGESLRDRLDREKQLPVDGPTGHPTLLVHDFTAPDRHHGPARERPALERGVVGVRRIVGRIHDVREVRIEDHHVAERPFTNHTAVRIEAERLGGRRRLLGHEDVSVRSERHPTRVGQPLREHVHFESRRS